MLKIPEHISTIYEAGLFAQGISVALKNEYKKWLHYYFDFCRAVAHFLNTLIYLKNKSEQLSICAITLR
ncbi:hypothetical protein TI05_05885 [Achromatium sp. WMS3]|nr:hypothetical protein TI05_05885 [Achromatium sp. WMS3]